MPPTDPTQFTPEQTIQFRFEIVLHDLSVIVKHIESQQTPIGIVNLQRYLDLIERLIKATTPIALMALRSHFDVDDD